MLYAISVIAEERIRQAQERGEFDDLPGRGGPLDLEDGAHVPPDLRMAWRLLKNGGYLDGAARDKAPVQAVELLPSDLAERAAYRRMLKLQVMEARMGAQRGCRLRLDQDGDYYARVVDRVRVTEEEEKS